MVQIDENLQLEDVVYPQNYQQGQEQQLVNDIVERINRNAELVEQDYKKNMEKVKQNLEQGFRNMQENEVYSTNKYAEVTHDTAVNDVLKQHNEQPNVDTNNTVAQNIPENVSEADEAVNTPDIEATEDEDNESLIKRLTAMADVNEIACNELGVIHYFDKNIDQAVEYFEKASDMGYSVAKRNLAIALENNNSEQDEKIFKLYQEAAEQGDVISLNNLGCCYMSGDGVEENIKKAVQCFEKAAEQGDELAKINLADCYAIGNGVRQNQNKAYKLYKEAAEFGNPTALKRVAECYLKGEGVTQNFRNALDCFHKAALKGDAEAQRMFERLAEKASPNKHSIDERLAAAEAKAAERNEQNKGKDKNRQEPVL
jgi:hypothetical protein